MKIEEVKGPQFKCTGAGFVGATWDGALAVVELIEVGGKRLNILVPPEGAEHLAERFKAAAEGARRNQATKTPKA